VQGTTTNLIIKNKRAIFKPGGHAQLNYIDSQEQNLGASFSAIMRVEKVIMIALMHLVLH
jgi:hypothetical protein